MKGKFSNEKEFMCIVKIFNKRQMSIEINAKDQNRIKKDKKNESQIEGIVLFFGYNNQRHEWDRYRWTGGKLTF